MKQDEAVVNYLSNVIGTLVGEFNIRKILKDNEAKELIEIITDGVNEITKYFNLKNFNLDSEVKV